MKVTAWFLSAFGIGLFYGITSIAIDSLFWTLMAGPASALLGFLFGFASQQERT